MTRRRLAAAFAALSLLAAACGGTSAAVIDTVPADEASELLAFYAGDFANRLADLDRSLPYFVYCRSGNRSGQTLDMMRDLGFEEVYNLEGGIIAWNEAGLPVEQ